MQTRNLLFGLVIALFATTSLVAQDDDAKAKKALDRATKNLATQTMKHFAKASLTDEQKTKATAVVEKHVKSFMEARKAQDALLTDEQKAKRKAAIAKAKEDGVKKSEIFKLGHAALGLSEELQKKFDEAKKKINGVNATIKSEITAMLTDEQKAAMPKKKKGGKGKGKGKKGKMKEKEGAADGNQTVSLKLPNMIWGGCASSVRTALKSVDGIADIKTDITDNTCTFKAPKDLDVKATLNKIVEGGNTHIKDWALDGSGE